MFSSGYKYAIIGGDPNIYEKDYNISNGIVQPNKQVRGYWCNICNVILRRSLRTTKKFLTYILKRKKYVSA